MKHLHSLKEILDAAAGLEALGLRVFAVRTDGTSITGSEGHLASRWQKARDRIEHLRRLCTDGLCTRGAHLARMAHNTKGMAAPTVLSLPFLLATVPGPWWVVAVIRKRREFNLALEAAGVDLKACPRVLDPGGRLHVFFRTAAEPARKQSGRIDYTAAPLFEQVGRPWGEFYTGDARVVILPGGDEARLPGQVPGQYQWDGAPLWGYGAVPVLPEELWLHESAGRKDGVEELTEAVVSVENSTEVEHGLA